MAKRLLDVTLATVALVGLAPLLALAAAAIRLSSPGPVLYRGVRVGRRGRPFRMYKLRTMHADRRVAGSAITAQDDPRVFPLGRWLRRTKMDELPQLLNVLRGEMSIVGPRPEDPQFVDAHYRPLDRETLAVRPGLASPGSLYNYTHGEALLVGADAERRYIEQLLPLKLALDVVYVRAASLWYDLAIIARTVATIAGIALGRRRFPLPPEIGDAQQLLAAAPPEGARDAPALARCLDRALVDAGIPHCHWKGHWKRERWAAGRGDLDLLVERGAMPKVAPVIAALGFREVRGQPGLQLPGTRTFVGFACDTGRFLNVHLHDEVVVGEPWRTHHVLPLGEAFLATAAPADPLPLPAPELEYLVFVVRTALRHRWRDALPGAGRWLQSLQPELAYLEGRADPDRVAAALARHLAPVSPQLLAASRTSLRTGASRVHRLRTARALRRALRDFARAPGLGARLRIAARHTATLRGRLAPLANPLRLAAGGRLVSLVGGDGAGKSTCTRELRAWLGEHLAVTTAHLGRPPRSLVTLCVGGALKLRNLIRARPPELDDPQARFPGHLALLRALCTARDRYALYARAARFARAGGIALCERHPIAQNRALVGPAIARFVRLAPRPRLAARLAAVERGYYERIRPPDVLLVLRVDPEEAVRRKTDEPPEYVRRRATAMWQAEWSGTGAAVIDAGRPLRAVLGDLKSALWTAL